jgi:hypothetical protein
VSNKFEKLIEYVINDEDAKASDLFHEIVVGKSREIYEGLMQDDMGGDAVDDFIGDVSADEEGIDYANDSDEDEDTVEMDLDGDETEEASDETEELEDRVVDLEDKLDELMAEFDDLIGDEAPEEEAEVVDMNMDDEGTEEADDAEDFSFESTEADDEAEELEESAELVAAPKPTTAEEAGINTTSANADDAGKKAKTDAKPVSASTTTEKGNATPKVQDMDVDGPEAGADLTKV